MRVHLGGDHAAYEMQRDLVAFLGDAGHEVIDHGPRALDPEDDYPVCVLRCAIAVAAEPDSRGIVLGGSGNGEQMAANKVAGIRAALCDSEELARLARHHNDAQIVSLGARVISLPAARAIVSAFLETPFSGAGRHTRRLAMIDRYERDGVLPG